MFFFQRTPIRTLLSRVQVGKEHEVAASLAEIREIVAAAASAAPGNDANSNALMVARRKLTITAIDSLHERSPPMNEAALTLAAEIIEQESPLVCSGSRATSARSNPNDARARAHRSLYLCVGDLARPTARDAVVVDRMVVMATAANQGALADAGQQRRRRRRLAAAASLRLAHASLCPRHCAHARCVLVALFVLFCSSRC